MIQPNDITIQGTAEQVTHALTQLKQAYPQTTLQEVVRKLGTTQYYNLGTTLESSIGNVPKPIYILEDINKPTFNRIRNKNLTLLKSFIGKNRQKEKRLFPLLKYILSPIINGVLRIEFQGHIFITMCMCYRSR